MVANLRFKINHVPTVGNNCFTILDPEQLRNFKLSFTKSEQEKVMHHFMF